MKKKFALHWQILVALILSFVFGIFIPDFAPKVEWMGTIFINLLKMIMIPLIISSIISGISGLGNAESFGRIGLKTLFYYLGSSLFAILTGQILVNIIKPGKNADLGLVKSPAEILPESNGFGDTLIRIVPENIFDALATNNMLSIIFVAMIFGFFISKTSNNSQKVLTSFFDSFFELMMKITLFIIKLTPFGVFGIVYNVVADQKDILELVQRLGIYMLVVIAALFIHAVIILPIFLRLIGKVRAKHHFAHMTTPLLTAFSTSSSNATLPLTISAVESNCKVSNKISSFTLPLGATMNMDGTALYEMVAVMFIAQAYGIDLTIGQQLIAITTALLASIGAAGIPMAGMIMMTIILTALQLPLEGVGLIIAVDRILDMFRTAVNVWSDSCGAVIIARTEGEKGD